MTNQPHHWNENPSREEVAAEQRRDDDRTEVRGKPDGTWIRTAQVVERTRWPDSEFDWRIPLRNPDGSFTRWVLHQEISGDEIQQAKDDGCRVEREDGRGGWKPCSVHTESGVCPGPRLVHRIASAPPPLREATTRSRRWRTR